MVSENHDGEISVESTQGEGGKEVCCQPAGEKGKAMNKASTTILKKARAAFMAFVLLLLTPQVLGQTLNFRNYGIDEGLPQRRVFAIEQDQQGYLWFGTQSGLCRFDGVSFKVYSSENGLRDNRIRALREDSEGNLWIGTGDSGLYVYDGKGFRAFSIKDAPGPEPINVIAASARGHIWVGADDGLYRYSDDAFVRFSTDDGLPSDTVLSIFEDREQNLWIGTAEGLCRLSEGIFTSYATGRGLGQVEVGGIAQDVDGTIWVVMGTDGLFRSRDGAFENVTLSEKEANDPILSVSIGHSGDLWIGTETRAFKRQGDTFVSYGPDKGGPGNFITQIFEDREGNQWFCTRRGAAMLENEAFVSYTATNAQTGVMSTDVVFARDNGEVWAGQQGTVFRVDHDSTTVFGSHEGVPSDQISSIIETQYGTLLFGTRGAGLFEYSNGRLTPFDWKGLPPISSSIRNLCKDGEGAIWIGTSLGVFKFHEGQLTKFSEEDGLVSNRITDTLVGRQGAIWIGTRDGLSKFADDEFTNFTVADGLVSNEIRCLLEDDDGILWVATTTGMSRFDGIRFTNVVPKGGFSNNVCRALVRDGPYLYIGTLNGLNRLNVETMKVKVYTVRDGLASSDINPRAMTKDAQGRLWIGTNKGLTCLRPWMDLPNETPPPIHIARITMRSGDINPSGEIELSHDENTVRFEFAGLSFTSPEDVRYQYRMKGVGGDWTETAERSAAYAFLPPGSYTFEVMARNNDMVWSEKPATYSFVIRPPFWATWWFRATLVVTFAAAIAMGHQMRTRVVRRHNAQLQHLRNYLANIINSMPSILIGVDAEGTVTQWNSQAHKATGVSVEEAVGKPLAQAFPRLGVEMERVSEAMRTREVRSDRRQARTEDGGYEDVTIYPLSANGVEGAVIRVDDVTERKQLEEQFFQAQKMEAVGQLAGGVAHDFNNLLQAIVGYGQMALEESEVNSSIRGELEEVMKAAGKATTLVRQLLAFSRKQVLQLENMILSDVVSDLAKMIQRVIGEHIAFNILSEPGLKSIHADKGQIEQILMNLCVNARDAMPDGGTLTIETANTELDEQFCESNTWAKPGRYVVLSVTDTGCGMDEETQRRIFEPFFTTKELGKGTGLGLSTIFGIARQHNGVIHVYSEVGVGTTFRIYLPMSEGTGDRRKKTVILPSPGGTETILLVDDDEGVRDVARRILEKVGYSVLMASDGQEAIRVFDEHTDEIDMALLDVVMPKLGGKAVFDHIQETRPEMPVLFASGYSLDAIHSGFVLDEGMQLIQKPYQINALMRRVRDMLDNSPIKQHPE